MDISASNITQVRMVTRDASTPNVPLKNNNNSSNINNNVNNISDLFFPSPPSCSSSQYKRIIIKDNSEFLEAEIKLREQYSNQLKSIDLEKYSFPNEFKPKTDYTYARSGLYLTSKINEDENVIMPNLCRRSRKPSPQNSFLSDSSKSFEKKSLLDSVNVVRILKDHIFKSKSNKSQSETQHSIDIKSINDTTSKSMNNEQSPNKYFQLNYLYGLDTNQRYSRKQNMTSANSSNTTNQLGILNSNDKRHVKKSFISKLNSSGCCKLFKWFLLFPLLLLSLLYILPIQHLSQTKQNLIHYLSLNTNIDFYNQQYLHAEINEMKEKYNFLIQALEHFQNSNKMLNIDQINAINDNLDKKLNATLMTVFSKISEQTNQLQLNKDTCKEELEQVKVMLQQIQKSYLSINDQSETNAKSQNLVDLQPQFQYQLENIIKKTLYTYNADKTGMTDFASESLGAHIMFTRCTQTYTEKSRWFTVLNIPLMPIYNTPRVIIQNYIQPGNCYAFKGNKAIIFIKLAGIIYVESLSLEHIPKELSPSNSLDTAPQNFSVYGYTSEEEADLINGILLGSFRYDNTSSDFLQFFKVTNALETPISVVELKIESNNGNKEYTCLYKFRVHGTMMKNP